LVDFDLTDEQLSVQELSRSVGMDVLSPLAKEAEVAKGIADAGWSQLLETGLVAPVASEYGGGGIPDPLTQLLAAEGLAYGDPAIAASAIWSGNAALVIGLCGTPEQCAQYLPGFSDPSRRASVAHYEGYGRAPSEYESTIENDGSDSWHVAGRKVAVPFAGQANPLVVIGIDRQAGNRLRAAVITEGVSTGTVTSVETYLGLDAAPLATVSFDTTVRVEQILGTIDGDVTILPRAICRIRLLTAAVALGCAQRAREYASDYATERVAFGKAISSFQGVAFLMADAQMQLDAARLQLWKAALDLEDADEGTQERDVSFAVNYSTSVAAAVTRDAVQVLGGHGFIADHPVERWYRAAAGLSTLDCDPLCSAFAPAL
jgi:alkylation response protein AidB-like acyl-CoA dehydrogenase